jgi:hypothetical protein
MERIAELNYTSYREAKERENRVKYLKSLGYRIRKVQSKALYWLYSNKKPTTLTYNQLGELYDREKAITSEGYIRVLFNKKSMRKGDAK